MLKLENSIRGLSFSRVAFDLTIQGLKLGVQNGYKNNYKYNCYRVFTIIYKAV